MTQHKNTIKKEKQIIRQSYILENQTKIQKLKHNKKKKQKKRNILKNKKCFEKSEWNVKKHETQGGTGKDVCYGSY